MATTRKTAGTGKKAATARKGAKARARAASKGGAQAKAGGSTRPKSVKAMAASAAQGPADAAAPHSPPRDAAHAAPDSTIKTTGLKPGPRSAQRSGDHVRADGAETKANEKYPVELVEMALRTSAGVYSVAAEKIGCARNTIANYVKRYPYLADALTEIEDGNVDLGEAQLISAMSKGESWAVLFYLRCKGKRRGYTERHEITGAGGGPVKVASIDLSKLNLTDAQLAVLDQIAGAAALG
jgi:hypothetical protein